MSWWRYYCRFRVEFDLASWDNVKSGLSIEGLMHLFIKKCKKTILFKFQFLDNYFPPHERRLTVPTVLTGVRFLLTPCIAVSLFYEYWFLGLLFFVVSAVTDVLDGFIARRYNQKTQLGACLDPLADKFLVIAVFLTLAIQNNPYVSVPFWLVGIVIIKDFLLIVGALFIFRANHEVVVRPTMLGKGTMVIQACALTWFLLASWCKFTEPIINNIVMAIVLFFVVASLINYVYNGWVVSEDFLKNRA